MAVAPVELTVSVGAPVIVQPTGEVQTVPVPESVLPLPPVARVPVNPVQVMLMTEVLTPAAHVQVTAPDKAVKNTVSAAPGTVCPPAPPSVNAHFVPAVASQVAVPPTQYLAAIYFPLYLCGDSDNIPAGVCRVVNAAYVDHFIDGSSCRQRCTDHGICAIPSNRPACAVVQDAQDQLVAVYRRSNGRSNCQSLRLCGQVILINSGNIRRQCSRRCGC